jgi:hypothetical protein
MPYIVVSPNRDFRWAAIHLATIRVASIHLAAIRVAAIHWAVIH